MVGEVEIMSFENKMTVLPEYTPTREHGFLSDPTCTLPTRHLGSMLALKILF